MSRAMHPEMCSMGSTISAGATGLGADPAANLTKGTTMENARMTKVRLDQHTARLARRGVDEAGSRRDVAKRWNINETTATRYATTHQLRPEFRDALRSAMQLSTDETTARAFKEAVCEAWELREIVAAPTEKLIDRGVFLLEREPAVEARENGAVLAPRSEWREAMRLEAELQLEAIAIDAELELRPDGVDLRAELQRRKAARAAS